MKLKLALCVRVLLKLMPEEEDSIFLNKGISSALIAVFSSLEFLQESNKKPQNKKMKEVFIGAKLLVQIYLKHCFEPQLTIKKP